MKKILYFLLFVPVLVLGQNHVKTTTYRVPTTTSFGSPTVNQAVVEKVFTDGLDRPVQHILHKQSASEKDIITHIYYDDHGRQSRTYLPYVSDGSTMDFDENAQSNTEVYYNKPEYQNTLNPYSEQFYEASPLSRVLKQGAPGNSWAGDPLSDNDHTIKFDYKFNSSNEVRLFKASTSWNATFEYYGISLSTTGNYAENELYKNIIKDENWTSGHRHTSEEFTDKQGRVVLKRTYDSNTNINTARHDTYYVYDNYGNLTYVIPPKAAGGSVTQTVLDDLCYQYRYDKHNRLVEKKQPGKVWEFIVYDRQDRVVATGPVYSPFTDSGLGWNVIKYDAFGRVAYTGWSTQQPATSAGRKSFQNVVDGTANQHVTRVNSTVDGISIGYNNNGTYPTAFKLLTVNYYDKYAYPGAITAPTTVEGQGVTTNLKGLATGSWVRVLTTSSATLAERTQVFYDQKARPIRTYKQNHLTGYTQTDSKRVDFTGVLEYTITKHKRVSGDTEIKVREDFEYTDHGRLKKHTHEINDSGNFELLSHITYNDLGQLITKKTGRTEGNPLQTVDYKYNIRGWLTDINNVDSLGDDLFAFKINYDTYYNATSLAQYNGNISETYWRTSTDNTLRKYGYYYDAMNRLTYSSYAKPVSSASVTPTTYSYNEQIGGYDKNGNITLIIRLGDLDSDVDYIPIDLLTYTYDAGNRLLKVEDSSNHPEGFKDGANSGNDYDYDDFGNMTQDLNKGIPANGIKYNHLNLPKEITFSGTPTRKITYLYNALGQKLEKKITEGIEATTTNYHSGFHYENEVLKFFATSEGYVNAIFDLITGTTRYNYVYNYTDHLGNIRLSYTHGRGSFSSPVILEENHYYPFGLKHKKYGSVDMDFVITDEETEDGYFVGIDVVPPGEKKPYQYKYNYREWQDELNLNVTAMDFRQYDNALGRFLNPDRLSELAPGITPYRFAFNNPNYWSDPTGLFESRNAAMAHINTYGLIGATVEYNDGKGVWEITRGNHTFYQKGNDLVLIYDQPGSGASFNQHTVIGGALTAGGSSGSWAGGSNVWGMSYLSATGFGGNGGFSASENGTLATGGGLFASALNDRATINQNHQYKYGTKTHSADQLTKLNKARRRRLLVGLKVRVEYLELGV